MEVIRQSRDCKLQGESGAGFCGAKSFFPYLACAAVVLLSGCHAVGPDYQVPTVVLQDKWAASAEQPAFSDQFVSADSFWASFHDPALLTLLQKANAQNLSLLSTVQQLEQARQSLRITLGGNYPSVQLAGSSNYAQPDIGGLLKNQNLGATTDQLLGQLTWEIDFWGKQRRAVESGKANLESTADALAAAKVSLDASVASIYCNVRVQEQRIVVAKANLVQQTEDLRIAEARFRLGATSELDWRQAQTQYEQTKSQLPALRMVLEQYQHALSLLLGEPPDYFAREFSGSSGLPSFPTVLPLGAPKDLLRRRPDVQQAERAAAAQSARIGQAQAALYPTFSLNGAIGYSTTNGSSNLFKWDSRAISYGAGFYLPIFDRGVLASQVKVEDSLFIQAVLAYQNQVLKAQQDVEDALSQIQGGAAQLMDLQRADQAAARSSVLALDQYRSGQTDYTTVSSAEQARLQTSDTVVQFQGSLLQAYISAYRAVGGGWDDTNRSATP